MPAETKLGESLGLLNVAERTASGREFMPHSEFRPDSSDQVRLRRLILAGLDVMR